MAREVYERAEIIPLLAEAFRELGYDGATMSRITERTGLGKGSLYHFFPGGKEEMAAAVLADIDAWFNEHIFKPLRDAEPDVAIEGMWKAVDTYFDSGRRVCLVGAFALDETRDRFAMAVKNYFVCWIDALSECLGRLGQPRVMAREMAEDAVAGIQGAIVLSRSLGQPGIFRRVAARMACRTSAGR
ncbi:MAG: TetR/AcrR family transcriptional regulator [Luteibacter sp.]|uniref:TetR/AcrR family transcriptional regulator n=1 Tax=Luteibacter TaxID=242605 RepID=UPI00055EBE92|nr:MULTISPECIES: TetR/AcrR family transcriptional regulator [unclassified Luteibacter]MDQ7995078.1 TetR/AcrR family transcriptional regulator [Luteibacter sp.]MDQ8047407.1 TetR/AcrR family transcriptional regulator [Luteibacter sp.]